MSKNIFKKVILLSFALICANLIKAQTTCSTSVTYSYPVTQTVTSYSNTDYWFKVTTPGAGNYQLQVANGAGTGQITYAKTYVGTCGSLTLCAADTIADSTQTAFLISLTNTVSTTYYVDLTNVRGTAITFSVTTIRQLYIGGQLHYESGQNDTLFALPVGPSGTQSYTWNPGGLTTAQIVVTPTVNTTYTLTYSDALGTMTDTATAKSYTLATCQLVPNGDFSTLQNVMDYMANVACPTSCQNPPSGNPSASAPAFWTSPTCGTADYCNNQFTNLGVPVNLISGSPGLADHTTGTTAHGYAGLITYWAGNNYREYLQAPLNCPLVTGQRYNISYWVSLGIGAGAWSYVHNPSNNIGAYLSASSVGSGTWTPLNYTPQVNASSVINNSGSWTQVSGTMTGAGEKFITMGNFYNDASTYPYPSAVKSYYFIDDISISPATPTITAGSCQSGSVTITALGVPNSTLTTWAGPGSYTATGNVITVTSPTAAATYTLTVNLATCCSNPTQTITLQPQATCTAGVTQPGSYTPATGTSFTASPGYFASSMTIGNNVTYTISSTDCRMASGVNITVVSGGTLTVQGSWLHVCSPCGGTMWQGIIVNSGGKLIINGTPVLHSSGNIIEDAVQAVYTSSSATATPIPLWNISNTIINNCSTGVYVDQHPGDLSSNLITSTAFTCRNIANHGLSITNIGNIKTNILASTPVVTSTVNPTDLTIAGTRTAYGIYVNTQNITYPIKVGGNSSLYAINLFDNLDQGIYAYKSSLTTINNTFQNLTGNSTDNTGVGIYSDASLTSTTGVKAILTVGNAGTSIVSGEANTFTNCLAGVSTKNMREVYINNNTFNNETTATTYSTTGTKVTGGYGVVQSGFAASAGTSDFENLIFANNTVQNCANGHFMTFKKLYNTASNSLFFMNNSITAGLPNYCSYGLWFDQASLGATGNVQKDALSITTNTITNANVNAIYCQNFAPCDGAIGKGFAQIYNNGELNVKYNSTYASLQSPRVAAISLSSCKYVRVTYNGNIHVAGFTGSSSPSHYHGGIYLNASDNCTVNCNTVQNTGEGIIFEGNCASSTQTWQENSLDHSKYGLVLRGISGVSNGIMGDQGNATYPIDDTWGVTTNFTKQTLCDGADPGGTGTSKLYTRGSGVYTPTSNLGIGTGGVAYSTGGGTPTLLTASGSNTLTCGAAGTGDRFAGNSGQQSGNINNDSLYYQNLQNDLNSDTSHAYPATRWAMQYLISSNMPGLNPVADCPNAKTCALADAASANGDYGSALSLINSFNASNTIETNWQSVLGIKIKLQNDTPNGNDINVLQGVAHQCPHNGGSIVWHARGILSDHYRMPLEYPNDCVFGNGNEERVQNASAANHINKQQTINLFPNPNNGSFTINYMGTGKQLQLEVYNLMGQSVLSQQYNVGNNSDIPINGLSEGVYFVKMIVDNKLFKTEKVMVSK